MKDSFRPVSLVADPASPVGESRRGSGGVDELTDLVRQNLRRMIAADGRSNTEIAAHAWPDVVPATGRRMITRALDRGWLRPEDAEGLMVALGVEHLAEFYLPAEPELTELRVRRIRLATARKALKSARAALKAEKKGLRAEVAELMRDASDLAH
jgi:hypothetical protein